MERAKKLDPLVKLKHVLEAVTGTASSYGLPYNGALRAAIRRAAGQMDVAQRRTLRAGQSDGWGCEGVAAENEHRPDTVLETVAKAAVPERGDLPDAGVV